MSASWGDRKCKGCAFICGCHGVGAIDCALNIPRRATAVASCPRPLEGSFSRLIAVRVVVGKGTGEGLTDFLGIDTMLVVGPPG